MTLTYRLAPNVTLVADGRILNESGSVTCTRASILIRNPKHQQTVNIPLEPYTEKTLWQAGGSYVSGDFLTGKRSLL